MKVENRDSFKTFFKYKGLQNKNKLLYLTSLKQKNKNRKKIFIYNIKGNKMTMNVFAHEFFAAEERAAFAERAFAEFMSRLRA